MAQSNQSPGSLRGVTPLAYAGTTPNMVFNTRRPTSRDVFNFELGTWWIIPKKKSGADASDPTREVWILVGNAQQTANWKKLHGGAGPTEDSSVKVTVLSTPGSGTFTFDPSMHQVQVECQGGGSGASGTFIAGAASWSGSSAGYCKRIFTSSEVGVSQSYVVGAAGLLGPNTLPVAGGNGGNTTFGSFLTAGGGIAGDGSSVPVGGSASGGDLNISGQAGSYYAFNNGAGVELGNALGSNSILGFGGEWPQAIITLANFNGANGIGYGSGGSCGQIITSAVTGGAGAQGVIIVTEYLS